jgi:hypothetical protein
MVSNFNILHQLSNCNDNSCTLVASNKWEFDVEGPVAFPGVEIGVTNYDGNPSAHLIQQKNCKTIRTSGVFDINQNLIRPRLWYRNLL